MNYPRLPRNIYSYRASVFGVPIRDALLISAIASASIIAMRISLYFPLISLPLVPWVILRKSERPSGMGRLPRLKTRARRFGLPVSFRIMIHNEHLFIFTGGHACLFYEIGGLNVLAMRTGSQKSVMDRLRTAIEDAGTDMDLFTVHQKDGSSNGRILNYRTYVRFSKQASHAENEVLLNGLSSVGQIFRNSLLSAGVGSRELEKREEIEGLLNSLIY